MADRLTPPATPDAAERVLTQLRAHLRDAGKSRETTQRYISGAAGFFTWHLDHPESSDAPGPLTARVEAYIAGLPAHRVQWARAGINAWAAMLGAAPPAGTYQRPARRVRVDGTLTDATADAVRTAAARSGPRALLAVLLMLDAGITTVELLALRVGDISADGRTVHAPGGAAVGPRQVKTTAELRTALLAATVLRRSDASPLIPGEAREAPAMNRHVLDELLERTGALAGVTVSPTDLVEHYRLRVAAEQPKRFGELTGLRDGSTQSLYLSSADRTPK